MSGLPSPFRSATAIAFAQLPPELYVSSGLKSAVSVPQKHATVLFFPDDLHPEAQWAPAYPSFAPNRYGMQIGIRPNST
jgi:hypothetical protein